MPIDITKIVEMIFGLCTLIITSVLIPYIRSKLSADQEKALKAIIAIAVSAAEQKYKDPKSGQAKKKFVLEWLLERGIKIDENKLDAMIEAAVYDLTRQPSDS